MKIYKIINLEKSSLGCHVGFAKASLPEEEAQLSFEDTFYIDTRENKNSILILLSEEDLNSHMQCKFYIPCLKRIGYFSKRLIEEGRYIKEVTVKS